MVKGKFTKKQKVSTLPLKEEMLPVSRLWFTVSGKIWKIEPSPEQTLSNALTGWPSRSIHFSYIWFDLRNSKSDFKERLEAVNGFFFYFADSITLFKKRTRRRGFLLAKPWNNLSKDELIILVLFLVPSTLMHKKMFFAKRKIILSQRLTLDENNSRVHTQGAKNHSLLQATL